jgi:hypothetical protein
MVPSLVLYLGGISMAIRLIQVEADPNTLRDSSVVSNQIRPWLLAFFSITAVQNALTTGELSACKLFMWLIHTQPLSRYYNLADLAGGFTKFEVFSQWVICEPTALPTQSNASYCGVGSGLHGNGISHFHHLYNRKFSSLPDV